MSDDTCMVQVWYKDEWCIAQYCERKGSPLETGLSVIDFTCDRPNSLPDIYIRFAEHYDQDKATRACTATKQAFNNIEASKHALDSGMALMDEAAITMMRLEVSRIRNEAMQLDYKSADYHPLSTQCSLLESKIVLNRAKVFPEEIIQPSLSTVLGAGILSLVAHATEKIPVERCLDRIGPFSVSWTYILDLDNDIFEVCRDFDLSWPPGPQGDNGTETYRPSPRLYGHLQIPLSKQYKFAKVVDLDMDRFFSDVTLMQLVLPRCF